MTPPRAPLRDLPTMLRVYPDDKRLTVTVPVSAFDDAVVVGEEVQLADRADWNGKPHPDAGNVRGRAKKLLVEVEIDLSTHAAPTPEGQEQLG